MRPRFKGYLLCLYAVVLHILKSVPVDERVKLVLEQQNEYELSAMRFSLSLRSGKQGRTGSQLRCESELHVA